MNQVRAVRALSSSPSCECDVDNVAPFGRQNNSNAAQKNIKCFVRRCLQYFQLTKDLSERSANIAAYENEPGRRVDFSAGVEAVLQAKSNIGQKDRYGFYDAIPRIILGVSIHFKVEEVVAAFEPSCQQKEQGFNQSKPMLKISGMRN